MNSIYYLGFIPVGIILIFLIKGIIESEYLRFMTFAWLFIIVAMWSTYWAISGLMGGVR